MVARWQSKTVRRLPIKKPAAYRGQKVEPVDGLRLEGGALRERNSLGRGSEVWIGLHAVFANVETFDLFLFSDTNAAEEGSDD